MTLKSFRKVCIATKVHYTICHKDGEYESLTVDYLDGMTANTNKSLLRILELEKEKTKIVYIATVGGELDVTLNIL